MQASYTSKRPSRLGKAVWLCLMLAMLSLLPPSRPAQAVDVMNPTEELRARGVQVRQHRVGGFEVLEVVLGKVDFEARLPVVMHMHGRGSDWHLPSGSYANIEQPYRLLVPRGPVQLGVGRAWGEQSVRHRKPQKLADEIAASADALSSVLKHFRSIRRVVGEPIVTGFSQGGMVALAIGVRHPGLVSAALPMAAHLVVPLDGTTLAGARLPEIHAVHGGADSVVEPGPAREAEARLRAAGFTASLEIVPGVGHEVTPELARAHRALLMRALERATGRAFGFGA